MRRRGRRKASSGEIMSSSHSKFVPIFRSEKSGSSFSAVSRAVMLATPLLCWLFSASNLTTSTTALRIPTSGDAQDDEGEEPCACDLCYGEHLTSGLEATRPGIAFQCATKVPGKCAQAGLSETWVININRVVEKNRWCESTCKPIRPVSMKDLNVDGSQGAVEAGGPNGAGLKCEPLTEKEKQKARDANLGNGAAWTMYITPMTDSLTSDIFMAAAPPKGVLDDLRQVFQQSSALDPLAPPPPPPVVNLCKCDCSDPIVSVWPHRYPGFLRCR
ncbi:unnamed protein product [Amoebophrya sp. A120]|nr:unnamed protein product [Amoebophrya sp. A120]|eukprot:GSA120T00019569001.1